MAGSNHLTSFSAFGAEICSTIARDMMMVNIPGTIERIGWLNFQLAKERMLMINSYGANTPT